MSITRDSLYLKGEPTQQDLDELCVIIPADIDGDDKDELFSMVLAESVKTIRRLAKTDHPKKRFVIGTEPEFNQERADELATFMRDVLPNFRVDIEVVTRDLMPTVRELKTEAEKSREVLGDLLAQVFAGIAQNLTSGGTKTGKDDCGCMFCLLRRRSSGIEEPAEYCDGKTPYDIAKEYTPEEWREIDGLHRNLRENGIIPMDEPAPSVTYGGSPAGLN